MQTLTLDNNGAGAPARHGPHCDYEGANVWRAGAFRCRRLWRAGVPEGRYSRAQNTTVCVLWTHYLIRSKRCWISSRHSKLHFRHTITHAAVQTEAE